MSLSKWLFLSACWVHHILCVRSYVTAPPPCSRFKGFVFSEFALSAIVYGPDGSRINDLEDDDDDDDHENAMLLQAFQAQADPRQLVRVACAQAPPPHDQIHPSQVTNINLVAVSLDQIKVGLGIPQSQGTTVQILVPISFQSCKTVDDMIDQIQKTMDPQAILRIRELEERQQLPMERQDVVSKAAAFLVHLSEEPSTDDMPEWWTWAELNQSLLDECTSLKGLLNEDDFATEIRRIARKHSLEENTAKKMAIVDARVAAVSPSGLYLKTLINEGPIKSIFPVVIRFESRASTADILRNNVLKLLDSLEEQVDEEELIGTVPLEPQLPVAETHGSEALSIKELRKQPKSFDEEQRLAAKYAAIADLGERAFAILNDLQMI